MRGCAQGRKDGRHVDRPTVRTGARPATFEELARAFAGRDRRSGPFLLDGGTIVVLPSLSFPPSELRKIVGIQYYEERMLFVLLLLGNPRLSVVYLTSQPVEPAIVDYYLGFLRTGACPP